jgi:hypothetical protein
MTAAEAINCARAAGLTLERAPGALVVRGPREERAALRPVLAPLAAEILRLLPPEGRVAEAPARNPRTGRQGRQAHAPQGRVAEVPVCEVSKVNRWGSDACDECGRPAWLSLVADDGARTCVDCITGRTALRARGVPA